MIKTQFGDFDGDSWEEICQICFQLKYEEDGYQEMVAHTQGDLGIEGYTRDGKVFQCYCPKKNYSANELFEKQRNKITSDLGKLIAYRKEIKEYLGDIKIKRWYFITPFYLNKDIVKHCVKKAEEMRNYGLDILDPNFDVLINDIKFIAKEIPYALNLNNFKINVNLEKEITCEEVEYFKKSDVKGIDNLVRKSSALIKNPKFRDKYIENQIKNYLIGKQKFDILDSNFKVTYEKILRLMTSFQDDVEDICMLESDESSANKIMKKLEDKYQQRLIEELGDSVELVLIDSIKRYSISDWLIRCPFVIEVEEG